MIITTTSTSEWLGIVAAIIGVLLTALVGLIAYLLKSFIREIKEDIHNNKEHIVTAQRHQDSMIHSIWRLIWRMDGIEDYLEESEPRGKFRRPREFPSIEDKT